jgi:hypothetical protein
MNPASAMNVPVLQFNALSPLCTRSLCRPWSRRRLRLLVVSCPSSGPMIGVGEELEPVPADTTPEPVPHYVGQSAGGKRRVDRCLLRHSGFRNANMLECATVDLTRRHLEGMHQIGPRPEGVCMQLTALFARHWNPL